MLGARIEARLGLWRGVPLPIGEGSRMVRYPSPEKNDFGSQNIDF